MEIDDFINQFVKLKEKEFEQKTWERWLVELPRMTEENFISFEEMLNMAKNQKQDEEQDGYYIDQVGF